MENESTVPKSINLKTLEGALCVEFTPQLTSEQLRDNEQSHGVQMHWLGGYVESLARSLGRSVKLDPCPPYPRPRAQG
jgi:hypothetical protein